jgi:hypothetical protein
MQSLPFCRKLLRSTKNIKEEKMKKTFARFFKSWLTYINWAVKSKWWIPTFVAVFTASLALNFAFHSIWPANIGTIIIFFTFWMPAGSIMVRSLKYNEIQRLQGDKEWKIILKRMLASNLIVTTCATIFYALLGDKVTIAWMILTLLSIIIMWTLSNIEELYNSK